MELSLAHRRSVLKAHTSEGQVRTARLSRPGPTSPRPMWSLHNVFLSLPVFSLCICVPFCRSRSRSGSAFLTSSGACWRRRATRRGRKRRRKKKVLRVPLNKIILCGRRLVSTQPAGGCHWGLSAVFPQGPLAETDAREIFGHETAFLEKSELSVSYFGPPTCIANMTLTVPISAAGVMSSYPSWATLSFNGSVSGCSPKTLSDIVGSPSGVT